MFRTTQKLLKDMKGILKSIQRLKDRLPRPKAAKFKKQCENIQAQAVKYFTKLKEYQEEKNKLELSHNPEAVKEQIPEFELSLKKLPADIYDVPVPIKFSESDGIIDQATKFANAVIQAHVIPTELYD